LLEFKRAFRVIYTKQDSWTDQVMESIYEELHKKGLPLKGAFEMISNGAGL
jgi:hypothetical protein